MDRGRRNVRKSTGNPPYLNLPYSPSNADPRAHANRRTTASDCTGLTCCTAVIAPERAGHRLFAAPRSIGLARLVTRPARQ